MGDDGRVSSPSRQPLPDLKLDRRHPVARRIIARWRQLISALGGTDAGEPTLVACSGGADSTALALAIASAGVPITLFFAEHRARNRSFVLKDRARVRALAGILGAEFVSVDCDPQSVDPTENHMRRSRYEAAAREARSRGIRFVATGHHADDQLETMLLALIRGAGPAGMAGMREHRHLDKQSPAVHLLRPMLAISRAEAESLCEDAGLHRPGAGEPTWASDHTNDDPSYLRNRIRREVVPLLEAIRPGLAARAARNAEWFRQLDEILTERAEAADRAAAVPGSSADRIWKRSDLKTQPAIVIGQLLRRAAQAETSEDQQDRFGADKLARIAAAVSDDSTEPRLFEIGGGFEVRVDAHEVELLMKKPRDTRG